MNLKSDESPVAIISKCIAISNNNEDPLAKLSEAISFHLNLPKYQNILELLQNTTKISDRSFLAICLLRFYKNHENIIDQNSTLKIEMVKLFDDIFANEIYKKLKINNKTQTYEKLAQLVEFIEKAESIKLNIDSLQKLKKFKQDFYKYFNGQYKTIITPFLEKNIFENEMSNIFLSLENYQKKPNLKTFQEIKNLLDTNIEICKNMDSEYNNMYILKPLEQILNLINKDFDKNPDSQPSKIIISSSGKRYPLLSPIGTRFNLIVQLKNIETGKAFNAKVTLTGTSKNINLISKKQHIGKLEGKRTINLEFTAEVISNEKQMHVNVEVEWENYNQEKLYKKKKLLFSAQRIDIDWSELQEKDPYSIEAVDSEDELIGRDDILNELYKGLKKKKNINSFYIHGQKRVGKTSIAKALKSKLEKEKEEFSIIYIEAGDSVGTTFQDTIKNLGNKICKHLKREYRKELIDIKTPKFDDSIQPIVDFLDDVSYELEDKKIVFIFDEFDEISSELYKRSSIGDAFFLTIRSLSNKSFYSFILVGGEKIDFIISIQGEQLNKFDSCRVDYFDKEHWQQFKELVQKPVQDFIDITDEAIEKIYNETAGNPFFTNVICKEMLDLAVNKKDTHITNIEVDEAIKRSLQKTETQRFSHFWEDGIREDNDKEEEISYKRRSVLLALSMLHKNNKSLTQMHIKDQLINEFDANEVEKILKEFVDRKILIENNDLYKFRINFFKDWLLKYGTEKIIMTLSDEQKIKRRKQEEKEAKINSQEIKEFIEDYKITYNGKILTTDDIRAYLEQFENNINQRIIFDIVKNCTYYDISNVKIIMKRIFDEIKSYIADEKLPSITYSSGKKITNVLVSNLDNLGKSSTQYAKYFADENMILQKNTTETNKILEKIQNDNNIKFLVFTDDFIGSGSNIIDNIKKIKTNYPEVFTKNIYIFIGVITGFLEGKEKIENALIKLKLKNIKIIIHEPLTENDKCFSDTSKIFTNPQKRKEAENLCWEKGKELISKNPLGYGNCQATVVFPDTCPNNCLPILWKRTNTFNPLFERKIT
ncbi:AAA family ATPase [Arcobacter sp. YIC-80]|uniref:phosphoribosyltransferase-like protein n=1 Tax=Arcobacter sp. YIC-80 TaxID=3376683 RepID=UPI00384AFC22